MSNEFKPLLKEVYNNDSKKEKKKVNKQLLSKVLKRIRNKKVQYAK